MVRYLRMFYVGWLGLIGAAILLQFYLAGYGVFAFNGLPPFDAHRGLGDLIGIAILIGVGLAFAARMPWRVTIFNIGLLVLMAIQSALAFASAQGVAALHVVNGVLIFVGVIYTVRLATRFVWPNSPLARPM